jgi:hypothetical protein
MSRTFRRQKGYVPTYVKKAAEPLKGVDAENTLDYLTNPNRWYRGKMLSWYRAHEVVNGEVFEYGTGKIFGQRVAMWFGDHGYAWRRLYGKDVCKFARTHAQTKHRMDAKQELAKYRKNEDYEVIIPRKELLPWD